MRLHGSTKGIEADGRTTHANSIAKPRNESVTHKHIEGLIDSRHVRQFGLEFVDTEQPRMRVEQFSEQRTLGAVVVGHRRSVHEHVFAWQRMLHAGRPVPSSGSNTNHSSSRTATIVAIQASTFAVS